MDEDVGPSRERDDLLGSLAGKNDQTIAEYTEPGSILLAGLRRSSYENACEPVTLPKILGNASIRIGTP